MENSLKAKKRDKLRIFSILAGIVFILIALAKVVVNGGYVLATVGYNYYFGYSMWDFTTVTSIISELASPLLFAFLALLAALILFIKKDSAAVFIPVGLLTYTIFSTFISPFIALFFNRLAEGGAFQTVAQLVGLVIFVVLAMIVTVLFFVAAVTFCKKHRYILMFLLFGAFVVGAFANLIWIALSWMSNYEYYLMMFEYFVGLQTVFIAVKLFVMPVAGLIINFVLCLAVLLAAMGMISRGNKKKDDFSELDEIVESAEA